MRSYTTYNHTILRWCASKWQCHSKYPGWVGKGEVGGRDKALVSALLPPMWLGFDSDLVGGLTLLLVLVLLWGFFSRFSALPPSRKANISIFEFELHKNQSELIWLPLYLFNLLSFHGQQLIVAFWNFQKMPGSFWKRWNPAQTTTNWRYCWDGMSLHKQCTAQASKKDSLPMFTNQVNTLSFIPWKFDMLIVRPWF